MNSQIKDSSELAKVKQKIRNLLNLANNEAATPGEVAAAMNRANKLMQDYMLEIKDIDTAKEEFKVEFRHFKWRHRQRVCVDMDGMICKVFHCEMVFNRHWKRNTIYGSELDLDTVFYMLDLVHNALDLAFSKYKNSAQYAREVLLGDESRSTLKNDFIKGFAFAVIKYCVDIIKAREEKEKNETCQQNNQESSNSGTSLVVIKNQMVKDFMKKDLGDNMKISSSKIKGINNMSAYSYGNSEGRKVRFNKGVKTDDRDTLRIT